MKSAIITGCTGQDGLILTNLLIKEKINVYGISKDSLFKNNSRVGKFNIFSKRSLNNIFIKIKPDFMFYFASFKHSSEEKINLDLKNAIFNKSYLIHFTAYKNILDIILKHSLKTKVFYASSSHIFGSQLSNKKLKYNSLFNPSTEYSITKTFGTYLSRYYREKHKLKVYVGIFFNHESEYSSEKFILSKIINSAINIKTNRNQKLILGSLNSYIDLGYAKDYMILVYELIRLHKPDDYIISSGSKIKIGTLVKIVFDYLKIDYKKFIKIDKDIVKKTKNLNLFGDNNIIKKTKAFKKFHKHDKFIQKIIKSKLAK
jgi:GDPmannose 4,6-dehydratase